MKLKSSNSGQEAHTLVTEEIFEKLIENGQKSLDGDTDHIPVVKLFTPDGSGTWLICEVDPDCPDIAFGLCDLGFGTPELGSVSLSEIAQLRGKLGLPVERDLHFIGRHRIGVYADRACTAGHIVE